MGNIMRYRTQGGEVFEIRGNKAAPLIEALRADMFTDPGSNAAYMLRVGNLVASLYGVVVDVVDERRFIRAMLDLGILQKV